MLSINDEQSASWLLPLEMSIEIFIRCLKKDLLSHIFINKEIYRILWTYVIPITFREINVVKDNICDALLSKFTFVRKLKINGNYNSICSRSIKDTTMQLLINLTSLSLQYNNVTSDKAIIGLTNLTHLNIRNYNAITDKGLSKLTQLRSLELEDHMHISDVSISKLTNLERLNIRYNCDITDLCLARLTNLTDLDIGNNREITDNSVRSLVKLKILNLEFTDEHQTELTYESISCLTNLTTLFCKDDDVSTLMCDRKYEIVNNYAGLNANVHIRVLDVL